MPWVQMALAYLLIALSTCIPGPGSRCAVSLLAACKSLSSATVVTPSTHRTSDHATNFRSATSIAQSSLWNISIPPMLRLLRKTVHLSPFIHATLTPTPALSVWDLSVYHNQEPDVTVLSIVHSHHSVGLKAAASSSQHDVNQSGSHKQSCQTLWATSPVLPCTSRCSQTPLELSKVLSDSARAFSGAPESTCSYGGALRMLRDLPSRIVKFWSYWDLCTDMQETSREAETTAWDTSRAAENATQLCARLSAVFSQQSVLHNHKACCLIIFIFVTTQYGMHYISLLIYIHTINLAADGSRA